MSEEQVAAIEAAVRRAVQPLERRLEVLARRFGDTLLDRAEAAAYANVSTRTLDRRVKARLVRPATPKGAPPRFTTDELDRAKRAGVL